MSAAVETTVKETVTVEKVEDQKPVIESTSASTTTQEDDKKEDAPAPAANLIPAPIPTSSPWKAVNNDIPTTSISVEDFDAIKRKSPTPSIKSNTSTKWVPLQASITVSNKNNNKNNNNNSNSNSGKRNGNNKHKQHNHRKNNNNKKNSPSPAVKKDEKNESIETSNSGEETQNKENNAPVTETSDVAATTTPVEGSEEQPQQPQPQHKQHKRYNNKHHHHNNRKFPNSNKPQQQSQSQNGFNPRSNNNNNNNPNFRHNNNNNNKHRNFRPQQMAQLYSMLYPFHYSMMAVNSVARQIEYYLSDENLAKDNYLKENLSKDGYVPLSLLAKFYRLLNMSFGGDQNVLMAALREIVFNENATVEVIQGEQIIKPIEQEQQEATATKEVNEDETKDEIKPVEKEVTEPSPVTQYFIRSKQWQQWVPENPKLEVEVHKTLSGNDLDEFLLKVVTVPHHHHHHSHRNHHNNNTNNQQESESADGAAETSTENTGSPAEGTATPIETEKSIPVEEEVKEGSVPVEVNQSS